MPDDVDVVVDIIVDVEVDRRLTPDERRRLIETPMSVFTRHPSLAWGGSTTNDVNPAGRRPPTPQDQDEPTDYDQEC